MVDFYRQLLGSSVSNLPAVDKRVMSKGSHVSSLQARDLIATVVSKEIDLALAGIHDSKAPGLDGWNSLFFKKIWHGVKHDFYRAILSFFDQIKMNQRVNLTCITLIPKVPNTDKIKLFRPISCFSVMYKIISKVLTHRLREVMGSIVSTAQEGFVPGRQLGDNVLLATEIIKGYGRKSLSPRCMIKLDMKKAYDSVEWVFLEYMLRELGFPNNFIAWVMCYVKTMKYTILINGIPTKVFSVARGLRQGDPLSSFLFALSLEYLSRKLDTLKYEGNFKYHPRCRRANVTHLAFTDDLLLFCYADEKSIVSMWRCFQEFSSASGLQANLEKSDVYIAGVSADTKQQLLTVLGIPEGSLPFRYLLYNYGSLEPII